MYLSISLPIYLSIHPPIHPSILSTYLSIYLSHLSIWLCIWLSIYLFTYLPIYLFIYLSISLSLCLSVCLSIYLSICKLESEAVLRDDRRFWTWQHQKRSNSDLVHFDFEMCFAPQRRALFRHRNFQKWTEPGVLCTFWLRNVLRATTACTFSTSQLPNRTWCALYILTSKCASRHNSVQFFISHLARWLRTRRFSEPTFRPPGATNHWKNAVFRDFPTFSRICSFFFLTLSLLLFSLTLPISAFHLSILSTSKLPSVKSKYIQVKNGLGMSH